jgi:hypothetical protein
LEKNQSGKAEADNHRQQNVHCGLCAFVDFASLSLVVPLVFHVLLSVGGLKMFAA